MSSEQDGPSGPGQPSSGRPRPPVTLDLKADEVRPEVATEATAESVANAAPEAAHDAAHDAAPAATAEPQAEAPAAPQSDQARSAAPERARPARLAGLVLGAAVGAAAGAGALLAALWYGGLAIGTGLGDDARGRIATLEAQVAELGRRPVPAPDARVGELGTRLAALERVVADLRQMEQRLAKAEATLAQPAAEGSADMTRRVAALEEATTTLASAIGELRKRLGEVAALAGNAAERAGGGQGASLGEEIGALGQRVAALEEATKALRTAQAAPPPPDRDLAARLATAALALRAAVESGRPFGNELEAVAAIGDAAARLAPLRAFAATGVPSAETLRRELAALLPTLRQAQPANAETMGLLERLQAGAARLVRIRRTDAPPSGQPDDVLGRVEAAAARGDLAAAVAEAAKLPDAMRAKLDPWLRRATERQAALAAASDLLQSSISGLARGGQGGFAAMIRVIVFLLLVLGLAAAGVWFAERPGDIAITWMQWRIETSLLMGLGLLAVLVVVAIMLWSLARLLWRSPRLIGHFARERRRRRGQRAISQGLVAVASGDMRNARKFAGEALRFAEHEPLTLLLSAQTAQLAGDRAGADQAFRAMAEHGDTRLLGLRGLYIEAQRRGDGEAVRRFAEEAARSAPALAWAGQAVFEFRCAGGDWGGALSALDSNLRAGLIERPAYRRLRAVLLTARALAAQETDPAAAKGLALEAVKLAPDLTPAVCLAARLASHGGELRRAAKLIEAAWRDTPHPELAEAYAHLRSGDSARERLARVQTLARLRPEHRESALALARAALDAQEFAAARVALAPLLANPTQRVAMLMAELEEAEHGDAGRAREWMSRAVRANGDPRWTADGMVSERWLPVSPVTGRIDAFAWRVPLAELSYGSARMVEKEPERPVEALPPAPEAPAALPAAAPAAPASASEGATPAAPADARPAEAAKPSAPPAARAATPHAAGERRDAIIPLMHAPDDPGPDHEADARLREPEARPYQLR